MSLYVDFKVSVWKRLDFTNLSPIDQIKAQQMVKDGISMIDIMDEFNLKLEKVACPMEELTVEDNSENATVELYKNYKAVWYNNEIPQID